MYDQKLKSFGLLKQKVEATFCAEFAACQTSIHDWKGKQIAAFQEALRLSVGAYVSEKWFYTHLKVRENEKLPRIDMLNLLAEYVGAKSWDDFVAKYAVEVQKEEKKGREVVETTPAKESPNPSPKTSATKIWMAVFGLGILTTSLFLVSFWSQEQNYRFCVVDQDDGRGIAAENIQAFWLKDNESPLKLNIDSTGCIEMPSIATGEVQLEIQALYYKTATIKRQLQTDRTEESIELRKDDYALMIHYFSTNKMEDWNKRRAQLGLMLSDDVRIIQVHSETGGGMALYNKEEFINKMTLPIKSLKNIEILETKYQGEQIVEIRFVQNEN